MMNYKEAKEWLLKQNGLVAVKLPLGTHFHTMFPEIANERGVRFRTFQNRHNPEGEPLNSMYQQDFNDHLIVLYEAESNPKLTNKFIKLARNRGNENSLVILCYRRDGIPFSTVLVPSITVEARFSRSDWMEAAKRGGLDPSVLEFFFKVTGKE